MTPVPKGLSRRQVLAWRKMISVGVRPDAAAAFAREDRPQHPSGSKLPVTLPARLA